MAKLNNRPTNRTFKVFKRPIIIVCQMCNELKSCPYFEVSDSGRCDYFCEDCIDKYESEVDPIDLRIV